MKSPEGKITFAVPIIIEKDNGGFHAYSPVFKGLHTQGSSIEEAINNSKNAIYAYLQSLINHGDPIPLCIIQKKQPAIKRFISLFSHHSFYKDTIQISL